MAFPSNPSGHLLAPLAGLVLAAAAFAQDRSTAEVALAAMSTQRKAMVADNMRLTPSEEKEFWPIYNQYLRDHERLSNRLRDIVERLAREFDTLDDETASEILESYHEFRKDRLELRWKTAKKLAKKIGAKRSGRFYQIENKIDMLMDGDLARGIPLVE